jgi:hypothetical protein
MKEDTYSYKGWLLSDSIIKRAFAIMGHYFVAYLIIILGMFVIGILFAIGIAMSGVFLN